MNCFVRISSVLVAIIGVEMLCGCAPKNDAQIVQDRVARAGLSEKENRQKIREITKRIEQAYDCQSLSFTANITVPRSYNRLRVETAMAPKQFKTAVYLDDTLVTIWTLIDRQFEECRLAYFSSPITYSNQEIPDRLDGPVSINLDFGIEQHLCGLSTYYRTWVGKDNCRVKFLKQRITSGFWLGQEKIDELDCDVVACLPNPDYIQRTEVLYIRPDGLLARRESIGPTEDWLTPHLLRASTYTNYRLNQVPASTWQFERK